MRHIFIIFLCLFPLVVYGQSSLGENTDFNPENPGDPGEPSINVKHSLTIVASPENGGTFSTSSTSVEENGSIRLYAYPNTGFEFVGWYEGDVLLSSETPFSYTMGTEDVILTGIFEYNPSSPSDPDEPVITKSHTLKVVASPENGGTFNTSSTTVEENGSIRLYAYANTGFEFVQWEEDGVLLSTESSFYYTMGTEDALVTGIFSFNPSNPSNPGKNHWDSATGEVIVDDFTAGSLSSAISDAIGGSSNASKVLSIIVAGQMSTNDFNIANTYTNCATLDLSRTYGYSVIPSYAFDETNLNRIVIPSCVESIEKRAFYNCSNLNEVVCYAISPPAVADDAFTGIADGALLRVVSSSVALYLEADVWKEFSILPITDDVCSLTVNLPEDASDGRYKNMSIELINAASGQTQKYVITNRTSYTFNGLLKNSQWLVLVKNQTNAELGRIEDISIVEDDVSVAFASLLQPQTVTLNVVTPDGADVTNDVQVTWFDSDDVYLAQGAEVTGLVPHSSVRFKVSLSQTLGMLYVMPADSLYVVQDESNSIYCYLAPLSSIVISGNVVDATTEKAMIGAVVTVSQMLNGLYSKSFNTKTDGKGAFSIEVFDEESDITISASDYISNTTRYENLGDFADLGTLALSPITGVTITTNFTYTESKLKGETAETQDWYSDYSNVTYSIYNTTQGKSITEFNVQYPTIVLLENVDVNDHLRITATSKNNKFSPVVVETEVDQYEKATVTIPIVELGIIQADFTDTDNSSVVGILYDSDGQFVKKYKYTDNALKINDLSDGEYTLVTMASSSYFNSILNISQLASSGLTEGVDFLSNSVDVVSGVISEIKNKVVPTFDESKLYYTGENTTFTVNKMSIVAGNYLTLSGKIDFKSAYANQVSDVCMEIDLPTACSLVENSVMIGSNLSPYTIDGTHVTIPLNNGDYDEQVRFCIIPTEGGDYAPNAFATFNLAGECIQQPIGSASYTVKDLSIVVPSKTAKTSVLISGTVVGKSDIIIYDNGVQIGQTTSLANGAWNVRCDIYEPNNLSTHSIYAKVINSDGIEMQSETKECFYDKNAIEVSNVTMTFFNSYYKKNIDVVFDFQTSTTSVTSYLFYTTTDFTFVVELTSNDTTRVSDVVVNVYTSDDDCRKLTTEFDESTGCWIATSSFGSGSLPVNVSVDFLADTEIYTDNTTIDEYNDAIDQIFEEYDEDVAAFEGLVNDLFEELLKDDVDEGKVEELCERIKASLNLSEETIAKVNDDVNYLYEKWISKSWDEAESDSTKNTESSFIEYVENYVQENYAFSTLYPEYQDPTEFIEQAVNGDVFPGGEFVYTSQDNEMSMTYYKNGEDATLDAYLKQEGEWTVVEDGNYETQFEMVNSDTGDRVVMDISSLVNDDTFSSEAGQNEFINAVKDKLETYADNDPRTDELSTIFGCSEESFGAEAMFWCEFSKMMSDELSLESTAGSILHYYKGYGWAKCLDEWAGFAGAAFELWGIVDDFNKEREKSRTWDEIIDHINSLCSESEASKINKIAEDYKNRLVIRNVGKTAGQVVLFGTGIASLVVDGMTFGGSLLLTVATGYLNDRLDDWGTCFTADDENRKNKIRRMVNNSKECEPFENDPSLPPFDPISPIHDPSGFVYEAVQRNRLMGVTATAYYKETVEDMYGDLHENTVLWDATEYAQENPLFTDENGMYAWDVPQGLWQVKFEKEGYETMYSEWLPVPPPQLDINIPMVQNRQPEVLAVYAYEEGVEIDFDKYMLIETLNSDNIYVSRNGEILKGDVVLLDEETISETDEQSFASRIRFSLEKALSASDEITLTVCRKVKSYAGLQMETDFTQDFDVEKEVKEFIADSLVDVTYGEAAIMVISALPAEAAAGKKVIVESSSSMICSVSPDMINLNDQGEAIIVLEGRLPGMAVVTFTIEDSNVKGSTIVSVSPSADGEIAKPRPSISSGSMVDMGAELYLTCETEDVDIYYTMDGSCPCDDTDGRILYDGSPIIINETVVIKAMAVSKDGRESDVVTLIYYIDNPESIRMVFDDITVRPTIVRDKAIVNLGDRVAQSIKVVSVNGVLNQILEDIHGSVELDFASLRKGMYLVVINVKGHTITRKVIKM